MEQSRVSPSEGRHNSVALQDAAAREHTDLMYQLAAEAANVGTWERDLSSDEVLICPIMARILELPPKYQTLSAIAWRDLILAEDLPAIEHAIAAACSSDQDFTLEYRVRLPTKRVVWIHARGAVLKDANKNPARIIGVSMDMTDKKRAEEALSASEERFRLLTELSPDGILVIVESKFVYANQAAARIFSARDAQALLGLSPADFLDSYSQTLVAARMADVIEHDRQPPPAVWRCRRLDGSTAYIQVSAGKVSWYGVPGMEAVVRDVTEQKHNRDRLRVMNERLKLAVEGIGEGIWDWDLASDTYSLSGGMKAILESTDAEGSTARIDWRERTHPEDRPRVSAAVKACLQGTAPVYQCEYRLRARNGEWKWVLSRGVIVSRDDEGRATAMTGIISDITEKKESEELVWRHANLDPLTGLPNRRYFRDQLESDLRKADRTENKAALLFIDLDGFKQVNDLYGHDAGDVLLMEVARRTKQCVRKTDILARIGGDEFTVLLRDLADLRHIGFVCAEILAALAQPFHVGGSLAYVTASIGVALYPTDAGDADELARKADQAMYAAKTAGKNQFSFFTPAMDEKEHARLRVCHELRQALSRAQLSLHYQPIVDLSDRRIVKAEALLRWSHPVLGDVQPALFISLAEESGLMSQIGNWVFREAAACSKKWSEQLKLPFQVSINQSSMQFMAREMEPDWQGYLGQLGVPGANLVIEISEGLLLHPSSQVKRKLSEYHDAGIQVAIDDFGTGCSSMASLQKFRIDYLKIDRSFVNEIARDHANRAIVETVIVMAHRLGLKVIAEGIETSEQMQILADAGCDYAQGFYLFRPLTGEQMERLLLPS